MKNRKKISSLLVVLAMFLQMIAGPFFGTVFAADNPQGQTVQIVPELSDGITVDASQLDQLVVKGTLCNGVFTYTESKTLTFTATLGDGWSFHSNYSSFFPSDSSHTSIQNNGSTVDFTYHVTQGQTVDFTDLQNVLLNATAAELPKLEITTGVPFGSITKETWVDANFQLTLGTKSFNSGNYTGTGSVKGRGNSSWLNPQKSYSLKLSQKESLLDIPKTKKYAIVAGYSDPSLMRNYITYKSGLKLQGIDYTPKCEFVKVYLNGTYNGIYILVERIDIESTKIDIEEATEENITGGYIIEKDAGDKVNKAVDPWFNAPFQANPNEDLFTVKAPDPVTDEMLTYLEEHMQKLNDALTGVSQEDYTKYIDSASWADFLIMQELSKNIDGNLKTSCYFYKEKDNDLVRMTALWDFDLAYGIANWDNKSDNNDRWDCPSGTGTSDFMVINSSCPWFKTLYAKPEFAALVKQRYTEYRYTLIPEMLKLINQQGAYLNSSVNGAPYTGSYQFTSGVSSLKSWLNGRISWLDNQWFLSPSVTVTPETSDVNPGNTQAFTANVENIPDTSVLWSVSGNTSAQTVIDPTGTLTVGSDEAASSLTVTATSLAASAASGSATIQVTTSSSSSNLAQGATILGKNRNTFNGEEIEKAFDGDEATKWCAEQTPSWVVFDIKTAAEVNRLRVVHASGSLIPEDERYNTVDFSLQVLDAEKLTETDFLAMDASQQQNVMADDSYWTNLKSYTGNSLGLTDDTFSPMGVRRIYRLNVTHADNNWWGGKDTVRIFEIQLFGNGEAPTKYPIHIESMNNGAVTADKATAEKDETVNLTVIPENGYRLVEGSLKANNMVIENASFMMPAEAVTITAQFEKIPAPKYNIHINEMENGTVTSDKQTAEEGETVQLMIAPVEGYQLAESSLKVNGVAVEGTSFTMPAEDVTIDAVFEVIPPVKYQILIDSPVNGTITADKQTAAEGETVTLTVTPDDGYRLVEGSLKANGVAIEGTSFTMPAGDVAISAEFAPVSAPSDDNLAIGAEVLGYNRTPFTGEEVAKAFDGDEATKWCAQTNNDSWAVFDIKTAAEVNRLRVVHASGAAVPEQEMLNTVAFSLQALDQSKLSEADFLAMDTAQKANVMADNSYWTDLISYTGNNLGVTDDSFASVGARRIYRMRVTDGDNSSWADTLRIYEIQLFGNGQSVTKYNVTIGSMTNGTVTANKQTAAAGETITLTVTPAEGYRLVEGSLKVNGTAVAGASFTMPAGNVTVTAQFEQIPATLYNVTIGSMTNGTVTADKQTAAAGETVTLTVTPNEGYRLVEGSLKVNGTAVAGASFTMPAGNVTVTAQFEQIPATLYNVTIGSMTNGTVTADKQTAAAGETVTLTVTPNEGYRVKAGSLKVNGTAIEGNTFVMPAQDAAVTAVFEKIPSGVITAVLESAIEKAIELKEGGALNGTMQAVVNEFNAALEAAQALIADSGNATQSEINAATVRLLSVMAKVDWKQGDTTLLEIAVQVAETIEPNLSLYVEAGKQEFIDALNAARDILNGGNAWDDEIQAAAMDLIEAMNNLRMAANKDILNGMINNAKTYDLSKYTEGSANAVRAALAKAEALAADENAAQDAVDAAASSLKAALGGLVLANTGNAGNNGTTAPVGDGSTPTKTGDIGVSALAALALISAAGVFVARKKRREI